MDRADPIFDFFKILASLLVAGQWSPNSKHNTFGNLKTFYAERIWFKSPTVVCNNFHFILLMSESLLVWIELVKYKPKLVYCFIFVCFSFMHWFQMCFQDTSLWETVNIKGVLVRFCSFMHWFHMFFQTNFL